MSFRSFVLSSVFLALPACSSMIDVHGDATDPEALSSLVPGETTYTEVQKILGTPSSKIIFDNEQWVYLNSKQKRLAFFKPEEIYRKLTVLSFNRDGVLQQVRTLTLEKGRAITPSDASTKTDERSLTVLDQMISNVGRVGTDAPVR